ncbi:MAG: redoxin domain-containing protein [Ignavibacteriales bacterium]
MKLNLIIKNYLIIFLLISVLTVQNYSQTGNTPQVKVIKTEELKKLIRENNDQPLLINIWATWCVPCREEFPELVRLSNFYKDKARVVGISIDDIEILNSEVTPFLKNQNAEFENYILKASEPEDFINLLSKKWSGAIPATFVYDLKGNQTDVLIGKQDYKSFEKAILKVID